MIIGVTGGIGSGKSFVLEILKNSYDAYIIKADDVAKKIMTPGRECYERVKARFGNGILKPDGFFDNSKISNLIYSDESLVKDMNAIVHPLVRTAIEDEIAKVQKENSKRLIVVEAALLIEAGYQDMLDFLWYVYCKEDIRINRLIKSRDITKQRIMEIMSNQLKEDEFRVAADVVIDNSGDEENTLQQISRLLNSI